MEQEQKYRIVNVVVKKRFAVPMKKKKALVGYRKNVFYKGH